MVLSADASQEGYEYLNDEDERSEERSEANDDDESRETAYGDWFWDEENDNWYWVYFNNEEADDGEERSEQGYSDGELDHENEEESAADYTTEDEETNLDSSSAMQTLVVYDWDDTLLPTSYIKAYFEVGSLGSSIGSITVDWELQTELEELEQSIIDLLEKSLLLGTVKIVTNGGYGWVEKSSEKFMPTLLQFLYDEGIEIISARWLYQDHFPRNRWEHKKQVFDTEVRNMLPEDLDNSGIVRFFSVGDSEYERYAAQSLVEVISQDWIKILKLEERPSIEQVQNQVDRLRLILKETVDEEGFMDFSFEEG